MIIASCGHEISADWHNDEKSVIQTKSTDNGKRVVVTQVVCKECRKSYARKKLIIKTDKEVEEWLKIVF